jgi:hypothetical protein
VYPPRQKKEETMNAEPNDTTSVVDPVPVYPEPPLRRVAPAANARRAPATAKEDPSRCQHRYENGTRCRTPCLPSQSGLCIRHFNLNVAAGLPLVPAPSDFEDLSADLLPQPSEFDAALSINQFLSRLLVLVTKGRVTPRRAAVMAYITNQILHSQRAFHRERETQEQSEQIYPDFSEWHSKGLRFVKSATPPPLPPVGTGPAVLERSRAYKAAQERDSRNSPGSTASGDLPRPDRSSPEPAGPSQIQALSRVLP